MNERDSTPAVPWWLTPGSDHCVCCEAAVHTEALVYCVACDQPLCPICVVEVLKEGVSMCPDCARQGQGDG